MSLIECPECGNEVSNRAASCPRCGFPLKEAFAESSRFAALAAQQDGASGKDCRICGHHILDGGKAAPSERSRICSICAYRIPGAPAKPPAQG